MRLTKVKLAGFKSFVDPTTVLFPENLTGVVGPNGCGKSNVIDAVRWVMGELSARHLRGESMSDVIFNGSSARKPVGNASVELVFDNTDGRMSGAYAAYNEISLKRVVSRDGSSSYFINGSRCRRKDITTLFLGTGLGPRSYAIIEQGMISRVIEARSDDMRNFVEEAAGISKYKERRRETETRVAETRENLERLQDLRDEVEKQIRHLQRQASVARRYQDLKNEERRLGAELIALRLRDVDRQSTANEHAVRDCDLQLQQALAAQRAIEAALERQREFHAGETERVAGVQARFYGHSTEVARTEQALSHARELRDRRKAELSRAESLQGELAAQIARDESQQALLQGEITQLQPAAEEAQRIEQVRAQARDESERAMQGWQQRWEQFSSQSGRTNQTMQVERARIEQLEDQSRRLAAQADRLTVELEQLAAADAGAGLAEIEARESAARQHADDLTEALHAVLAEVQALRQAQQSADARLEASRLGREKARAELVSLEAVQRAALGDRDREASRWLSATGLSARPRLASQLEVNPGWERGVEAVLGDALEAVCVDGLDALVGDLGRLQQGQVMLLEPGEPALAGSADDSLAAQVRGPAALLRRLAGIRTAPSLAEALASRRRLGAGESFVTPTGEWLGPDWLRVVRGEDVHAGVLEREHRLKALRQSLDQREEEVMAADEALAASRGRVAAAEQQRDSLQAQLQAANRAYTELRGQAEAGRVRAQQTSQRRDRILRDGAELDGEREKCRGSLARAREAYEQAASGLDQLDALRRELELEREDLRAGSHEARQQAQAAQLRARELLIQLEGRRSTLASVGQSLQRMLEQREQATMRREQLQSELQVGDEPLEALALQLEEALSRRFEVEAELTAVRAELDAADAELRQLDERRQAAGKRVAEARSSMEDARLAAQESRLRLESLAEQFRATRFDLDEVMEAVAAATDLGRWESRLASVQADLQRLGQVNLAAIDELREQTERKTYLDAQHKDLTDALDTLEQAMRKIDRETRTRFEDTFNRINAGLKEKFPRLFGGGHAYLEMVGEDPLTAGVAVMARPPGKRISSISQLSGGEKALTAVALVFSIFDLNPAPFCLLDEVDAPLDESNVGRFCEIVREMSARVQFIFITHNKTTMELAAQLVGVTMNEPGVSRLVSVDVDEAVRMAQA
ncbi:MAG: hypothetical protein RL026_2675 [Pseudomonadota bacterium]|jgi:chromosome segregation protein